MSIQDFAAFAEIIASLGVIFSLVYVARQIRQTNTLNRSAAHQAINTEFSGVTTTIATNPELAALVARVHYTNVVRDDLNEVERIKLGYLFTSIANQIYFMYQQLQEGILSEKEVSEWQSTSVLLGRPYMHSLWPVLSQTYPVDFRRWFEARYNLDPPPEGWRDPFLEKQQGA